MALAVLCGSLTIGSSIGLMAVSAFIIATAARHPSMADLAVAVVAVRAFGISRGVFRYLERLVSHRVNFQLLVRLRVWFYQAIEPRVPARWANARSGDWLSRFAGDIETLQNLEEALEEFAGCAVVISHDRWFLDRLATHILAFEGDSHVEWFEGNFEAYEEDKKRRLGADSLIPHRIKFQKFGR